jgi:ADP-ribose pyrophosphatase YjhB (NUDIX family)
MVSFEIAGHRFNLRAAAIFLQNHLALPHRMEDDATLALPGDRVEPDEDAASAVVREVMEELGEEVKCGDLIYIVENFFEHRSKQHH